MQIRKQAGPWRWLPATHVTSAGRRARACCAIPRDIQRSVWARHVEPAAELANGVAEGLVLTVAGRAFGKMLIECFLLFLAQISQIALGYSS